MLLDNVEFSRLMSRKIHFVWPKCQPQSTQGARFASILSQRAWNKSAARPSRTGSWCVARDLYSTLGCIFSSLSVTRRRHTSRGQSKRRNRSWSTFQLQTATRARADESISQCGDKPRRNQSKTARFLNKRIFKTQNNYFPALELIWIGLAAALGGFVYKNIWSLEVVAFLRFVDTDPLYWKHTTARREKKRVCFR